MVPIYDDSPTGPEFDPYLVGTGLAEEQSGCELTLPLAAKEQPTASKNKNHLSYKCGHSWPSAFSQSARSPCIA